MIHVDFETYSELDVRNVGAYRYAEHPSTEVLIMCYAFDDEPVKTWTQGKPFPQRLADAVAEGVEFGAHNTGFEYCIWNIVLARTIANLPPLRPRQLNCTATRAAMAGLPRSLGKAGAALSLKIQKDKQGDRLIKFFCGPRKPTKGNPDTRNTPEDYPAEFQAFISYCKTDVESERELHYRLPAMHSFDRMVHRFDTLLNDRGIPVDIPAIKRAAVIVRELEQRAHDRVKELTGGIAPTQVGVLKQWMADNGVELDNMQATTLKKLLDSESPLPSNVLEVLRLRMEAGKVSTKKMLSMLRVAGKDHRARGTLMVYGAHTGRWSGKLIQPHNFIRGLPDKKQQIKLMDIMFPLLFHGDADLLSVLFDAPLTSIAQCMRGFIAAKKDKILRIIDYAQIEARILVWLAQQEDVLAQFRKGLDVYKMLASFLWGIPVEEVSSEQRRIAKNLVLGCGFGLGAKKFIEYCAKADVVIDEEMSQRAVRGYRERNSKVVAFWYDVERCAVAAIQHPSEMIRLRNLGFIKDGDYLRIVLPSGRSLHYPFPEVRMTEDQYGRAKPQITFMTEFMGVWMRVSTYGGRLVENIVQAVACDVMVCGGAQIEKAGYPLILTVHDEWLSECDKTFGSVKEMEQLACKLPSWIGDCPVTAEGFETIRYRKN